MNRRFVLVLLLCALFQIPVVLGQPSAELVSLNQFDYLELTTAVTRSQELRELLQISEGTNKKLRAFVLEEDNSSFVSSFYLLGEVGARRKQSMLSLDDELIKRLRESAPEYDPQKVRAWAIRNLHFCPEAAFRDRRLLSFFDLNADEIKRLNEVVKSEAESAGTQRTELIKKRAMAIVARLPENAQQLFANYAGSELLPASVNYSENKLPERLVCYAFDSAYAMVNLCNNPTLHEMLDISPSQTEKMVAIHEDFVDKTFKLMDLQDRTRMSEMPAMQKKCSSAMFDVLTKEQTKKLQQWIALEYFQANPKRELSRNDLRSYLGFADNEKWKSLMLAVDEEEKKFEEQSSKLNAGVLAKILQALSPDNKAIALKLFQDVW